VREGRGRGREKKYLTIFTVEGKTKPTTFFFVGLIWEGRGGGGEREGNGTRSSLEGEEEEGGKGRKQPLYFSLAEPTIFFFTSF